MQREITFLLALFLFCGCTDAVDNRQTEVAQRGAQVMPFDLDKTTHVFEKLATGGLQTVVSDDHEIEQVQLVQAHLETIATRFNNGDFHDPEMIHGHAMPGLHELTTGYERIDIQYSPLEYGGQIRYTTSDTSLTRALHSWFDAQVSDHGAHAQDRR